MALPHWTAGRLLAEGPHGALFLTDSLQMWHAVVLLILHGLAGVLWNPAAQIFCWNVVAPLSEMNSPRVRSSSHS